MRDQGDNKLDLSEDGATRRDGDASSYDVGLRSRNYIFIPTDSLQFRIVDDIPGSGGVRKLRWSRPGMGKRSGLRVIYFVRYKPNEFWMLTIYAKAKHDNVPAHILKQLLEVFRDA